MASLGSVPKQPVSSSYFTVLSDEHVLGILIPLSVLSALVSTAGRAAAVTQVAFITPQYVISSVRTVFLFILSGFGISECC